MGYTTDFDGSFSVTPPLDADMVEYLQKFASTRRMRRNNDVLKEVFPDWKSHCFFGELGDEGEYFVTASGNYGQDYDDSIVDYNNPPSTQPGLWCQWIPSEDGSLIEWDQGEKFYHYIEWIEYIIDNFLKPNGYALNGVVDWYGEDREDIGRITIEDNHIELEYGHITFGQLISQTYSFF